MVMTDPNATENTADENARILEEMDEEAAEAAEAERKKQEKQEKKEKKKAEKQAKKEAKAAKKAAKPPKEKKPKKEKPPKEPQPKGKPLPKGPVAVLLLLSASLVVLVLVLVKILGYGSHMSNAETLYASGEYEKAYEEIAGVKLKDDDVDAFARIRLAAMFASYRNAYDSYVSLGETEQAVDRLICIIGVYEANDLYFDDYGMVEVADAFLNEAVSILSEEYGISREDALALYRMRSREDYTIEIYKYIR